MYVTGCPGTDAFLACDGPSTSARWREARHGDLPATDCLVGRASCRVVSQGGVSRCRIDRRVLAGRVANRRCLGETVDKLAVGRR
jgi:hypothetical protein